MIHKLEVKLKQHTPLIHFQHDQEGATLRASEVKPKLDRFIISKLGDENYESFPDDEYETMIAAYEINTGKVYDELDIDQQCFELGKFIANKKGWFIGSGEHLALAYRMKITPDTKSESIFLKTEPRTNSRNETKYYSYWVNDGRKEEFPLLLSNMGGKDSEDDLCNLNKYNYVSLIFSSSNKQLIAFIRETASLFFARRNFGQRQDKGFGSFSVVGIDGVAVSFPKLSGVRFMEFEYEYSDTIYYYAKLFSVIDFYWKCLKSGINYTQDRKYPWRYIKAYLWKYLNDKEKQTWEKRSIKEFFHLTTGNERPENPHPASFARALLGCPDKFEYKKQGKTINIHHSASPDRDSFIARIPSPIVFKPIIENNIVRIYIIPDASAIKQLSKQNNLTFLFEGTGQMELDVNPQSIDLESLLRGYHQYIEKQKFGEKAFVDNNGTLIESEYEKFREKNCPEDLGQWFVPLDFKWKRIINSPVRLYIQR